MRRKQKTQEKNKLCLKVAYEIGKFLTEKEVSHSWKKTEGAKAKFLDHIWEKGVTGMGFLNCHLFLGAVGAALYQERCWKWFSFAVKRGLRG